MEPPTQQEVVKMVELALGASRVQPGDRFIEDLGAESVDIVNLISTVEGRFGIHLPEEQLPELRTPAELQRAVEQHLGGSDETATD